MAATKAGDALTEAYRQQNMIIQQVVIQGMSQINRAFLLPAIASQNTNPWVSRILAFGQNMSKLHTGYTQNYLKAFRVAEGVGGTAPQMPQQHFNPNKMVGMAMATAFKPLEKLVQDGSYQTVYDIPTKTQELAMSKCNDWAVRNVQESSRRTIVSYTRSDDRAVGYARVTDGSPCKFCAMLATRGPVYSAKTVDFPSHSKCACGGEPVYENWSYTPEVEAQSQKYMDEYRMGRNDKLIKELEQFPSPLNEHQQKTLAFYKQQNADIKSGKKGGYLYDNGIGAELGIRGSKREQFPDKETYMAQLADEKKNWESNMNSPFPTPTQEEQTFYDHFWKNKSNGEKPEGRSIEIAGMGAVGAYERMKGFYVDGDRNLVEYDMTAAQVEYTKNKRSDWKF